jgi:predicted transcriptional regulator
MKQLTKAEEEVMQILWEIGEGNVASILSGYPEPQPAYNTVSTIVRILESKGFVDYRKEGRSHIYYPLIKKSDYSQERLSNLVDGYFQGSFKSLVSFFVKKNDLSTQDLETILKEIDKNNKS